MATLDFKGKALVQNYHLSVKYHELVPKKGKSLTEKVRLDDNLIIHGDNLKALKALLPIYAGRVNCIFIDPPYNTGNESWAYNDNVNSPMLQEWLGKTVDRDDLTRHDKWLCMMWPRLCLLKELLADDGVIFITLDDNEQHRMRSLLDELFVREESFYTHIAWQKKYSTANDALGFSPMFDHILVYRKSAEFSRNLLERTEENDTNYRYKDKRGVFRVSDYTCNKTADERENLYYSITNPNTGEEVWPKKTRVWGYSVETHAEHIENDLIWWGEDGKGKAPGFKRYRHLLKGGGGTVPSTWWPHEFAGHTDEAKKEIRDILSDLPESLETITPKPVRLLQRILELATDENSLVLDSFAGSGTTAHALLALNAKDGGNRRFILCETEDYADTLTAERVRRVIRGYDYTGTAETELMPPEKVTWTTFCKDKARNAILNRIEGIETLERGNYDKIEKKIEDGVLTVVGKKTVAERMPGLGGSFTYVELGKAIELDSILDGKNLPSYLELARYVFYTATGEEFDDNKVNEKRQFVGESRTHEVFLFYKPDIDHLKKIALTLERGEALGKIKDKRRLVFAPTKYLDQEQLDTLRIDFAQLPFEIYKLAR